ncbi:MAG: hypothetical protein GF364_10485, partial [Candidatus Lokiarchaeota archaeon]|nr:hypothetical protein [Candidatus Lokiarchaeota archaeon]
MSQENFIELMKPVPKKYDLNKILDIVGPFDGKINSIYHIKTKTKEDLIFRARVSQAFRYEDIIKDKILFPFLDGKLSPDTPNLSGKIENISNNEIGSYVFKEQPFRPIHLQNLLYFDETKEKIPYKFAVYD